ncbi:hypothetical protein GOQ27_03700 [Clostridium sp. D2Q-11]|uniref:Uncharacterized protein n=1 Tax=Anaeromonas frigoriresistens TaxID=2683708 RepID=A0A942UVB2_9FIRM|nr:hypothetical protein [Anaeromonas frigoriresistens]MBS4537551.1 hypothetical protein [Anaeromonas frigoriresistens]
MREGNIKTNMVMDDIIDDIDFFNISTVNVDVSQLLNVFNPKIKDVYGCLIIDNNDEIQLNDINFHRIISMYGDKTGYEASCNEIRLNDYIKGDIYEVKDVISLGFMILNIWSLILKESYPNYNFCLIISSNKKIVTLRFHIVREEENIWLSDNLQDYKDEAVAYKII